MADGVRPLDDAADEQTGFRLGRAENPLRHAQPPHENRQRMMQQHRAQGADHHDDECGRLQEQADLPPFHRLAAEDGDPGQAEPDQAATIHASSLSLLRSRAMA